MYTDTEIAVIGQYQVIISANGYIYRALKIVREIYYGAIIGSVYACADTHRDTHTHTLI